MGGFARLLLAVGLLLPGVVAAQEIRIGIVASQTGPQGVLVQELMNGYRLALKKLGGKIAGQDVKLFTADDQDKADLARQAAERMLESDRVQVVTGAITTNMVISLAGPVANEDGLLLSSGAGPAEFAGRKCLPQFFALGHENITYGTVTGEAANDLGIKRIALIAWNSPGGRDMVAGFKRGYKGEAALELYTPLQQLDFAGEIAQIRAAKPDGVFFFYPGALTVAFVKQLAQFGVLKEMKVLAQNIALDNANLAQIGEAATGVYVTTYYAPSLDNAANQEFVRDYLAAYDKLPGTFAALASDQPRLLDAALKPLGGKMTDKLAVQRALENVRFDSVRGPFAFNTNHFPIETYYLTQVGKRADGRLDFLPQRSYPERKDPFYSECKMGERG